MGPPIPLIPQGNGRGDQQQVPSPNCCWRSAGVSLKCLPEGRWTVPAQPTAADLGPLPASACALSGALSSCSGTWLPLTPSCSLLGMCPGFLTVLLASSNVSALPSRLLFLCTGTLILIYSIGSSCLWTDVSQRRELNPARLDHTASCRGSWDGGYGGSGKRPILLSVEGWRWVAWGKENCLGEMGQMHYKSLTATELTGQGFFDIFIVPALFCLIV